MSSTIALFDYSHRGKYDIESLEGRECLAWWNQQNSKDKLKLISRDEDSVTLAYDRDLRSITGGSREFVLQKPVIVHHIVKRSKVPTRSSPSFSYQLLINAVTEDKEFCIIFNSKAHGLQDPKVRMTYIMQDNEEKKEKKGILKRTRDDEEWKEVKQVRFTID